MSQTAATTSAGQVELPSIPLAELAPWALLFGLLATLVLFFVSAEQGAFAFSSGTLVHELVHDGRHLLGYPCH